MLVVGEVALGMSCFFFILFRVVGGTSCSPFSVTVFLVDGMVGT